MLVQDFKKPNREPVEVSAEGLKYLQSLYGNRYRPLERIVPPEKIEVTKIEPKKDFVTPAKTKKG